MAKPTTPNEDGQFILTGSFELIVPSTYRHARQLKIFNDFAKKRSEGFRSFKHGVTDDNFAQVTHRIMPGKKYSVKIFRIAYSVTSEECIDFLGQQKALLVGAQGISLARQLAKDKFPLGWTASFDEPKALYTKDSVALVPCIKRDDLGWELNLGLFPVPWPKGHNILCFTE